MKTNTAHLFRVTVGGAVLFAAGGQLSVLAATEYTSESTFLASIPGGVVPYLEEFGSLEYTGEAFFGSWRPAGNTGGSPAVRYDIDTVLKNDPEIAGSQGNLYAASVGGTGGNICLGSAFDFDPLRITFTSGNVRWVGGLFFLTDVSGESLVAGTVRIGLSDGTSVPLTIAGPGFPLAFRGYQANEGGPYINSLTVENFPTPNRNDIFREYKFPTIDHFYVAAVPEPGTYAVLVAVGLLGLGLHRRFRKI